MDDRLGALLRLQEIDNEIERTNEQLRSLPIRVRAAERELARGQQALETLHQDLIALQKQADQKELQLRSSEANASKFEAQRLTVKTNREYQALTAQIGGTQADNARLEDQILALYAMVEQAQKAHDEQAADVQRLTEQSDRVRTENLQEAERFEARLAELRDHVEQARQQIPAGDALHLYSQLRGRLDGPPLAVVLDEVCSGCNMNVPPQTISALRLARDLVQCTSCTRILYLDGEES